MSTALQGQSN